MQNEKEKIEKVKIEAIMSTKREGKKEMKRKKMGGVMHTERKRE